MTAIESAIKDAVEKGGYVKPKFGWETEEGSEHATIFLDPSFWQALGKARGWKQWEPLKGENMITPTWLENWHRFIDHLAEGKDAESFFKELV